MNNLILGAIAGDIIGSIYESNNIKTIDFPLIKPNCIFTDDTVLTIATMDAILTDNDYVRAYQYYGEKYPGRGYGGSFQKWKSSVNPQPYNSFGNGSAMRVSPVGYIFQTLDETLQGAKQSAEVTHNHPEGIKGAQCVASTIFLAKEGRSKDEIKTYIENTFGYDLKRTINAIRPNYKFDVSCQGSVPEAIISFLESADFESAIRLAISIGGDSDTIACITGSVAEAFYDGVPELIANDILLKLPKQMIDVIVQFSNKFN